MSMFFSKSTGGFYSTDIHGDNIPADAVEFSEAYYLELMQAQSQGKIIKPDANGFPIAVDYEPTAEEKIAGLEITLRNLLDSKSKEHGFDSYQSAMNWAGFPNPYQTQAHTIADWIAACWAEHFIILFEINSTHVIPSQSEYLARLPNLEI